MKKCMLFSAGITLNKKKEDRVENRKNRLLSARLF